MDLNRIREQRAWSAALLLLLAAYLAVFAVINFIGMPWFMDADVYSDTLVARYIWEKKQLFPDGWVYGNQYYVVATPVLAALFYGLTGSMNLAMALATTAMTAFQLIALWWMLRPFLSRNQILTAEVALVSVALAMGLRTKREAHLLFLLASYYACYLLTLLVVWGDYLHGLFRGKKLLCPAFFLGLFLSFGTGMQSLRQTCIMVLPLLAFEGLRVIAMLAGRRPRDWTPTVRALACAAANGAGLVTIRLLDIPSSTIYGSVRLLSPDQLGEHLHDLGKAVLEITGFAYRYWTEPAFLLPFCTAAVAVVAAALIRCLYGWLRRRDGERAHAPVDVLLALCVISLLGTAATSLVLDMNSSALYLFLWYLLVALSAASLTARCGVWGRRLVLGCLCALSLCNLHFSYSKSVMDSFTKPANAWSLAGEALMELDYELLYGRWDFANMVAGYTDGKVVSASWYNEVCHVLGYINPQDLYAPEDNDRAVYLFLPEQVEAGMALAQANGAELTLIWETPGAALYTSDKQLMWLTPGED